MGDTKVFNLLISSLAMALLSAFGILLMTVVYSDVNAELLNRIQESLVVDSTDAVAYAPWADSDDPDAGIVYATYYVYDIQNAAAVLTGAKPLLVEVGPLTYIYHNKKYNATWDSDTSGDIVSYQQYQYYTVADESTAALGEQYVTTLNIPLLSVLTSNFTGGVVATTPGLSKYTNASALFIKRKASQVVWGWDNDTFLTEFNAFNPWAAFITLPTTYPGIQNNDSSLEYALATHSLNSMHTGVTQPGMLMQLEGELLSQQRHGVMLANAHGCAVCWSSTRRVRAHTQAGTVVHDSRHFRVANCFFTCRVERVG